MGCGGQKPAPAPKAGDSKPAQLTVATGPSGGNWYSTGATLSDILSRAGVPTSSMPGGGTANIVGVGTKKSDFAISQLSTLASGIKGEKPFDKSYSDVVMLMRLDANPAYIIVPADSPIKTIADLKGKKVAGPAPGSSSQLAIGDLLTAAGLDEEKDMSMRRGSISESAELLKDRLVDAYILNTGVPNGSVSDIAVSLPVRFLSVPDDIIKKMAEKNTGYSKYIIPAGTYTGQTADIISVSSDCALVVNKNMPDEHAYWLAKNIAENWGAVTQANSWLKSVKVEKFGDPGDLPIHPGAAKYFQSKK